MEENLNPVTNVTACPYPIRAIDLRNNQPVTIIRQGDRKGSSAVCEVVDEHGVILDWAGAKETYRVNDTNVLPPQPPVFTPAQYVESRR